MRIPTTLLAWALILACVAPEVQGQVRRADRARERGEREEALQHIKNALEKDGEDAEAYEVRGKVFRDSAAVSEGDMYFAALQEMMDGYSSAGKLDPKLSEKIELDLLLVYQKNFNRGIEAFNYAQAAQEDSMRLAHFASAVDFFRGATIVIPDSAGAYVNMAFALISSGNDVQAIEPLKKAITYGKPDSVLYDYLSRIYLTNDMAEDAVDILEDAVTHFSGSAMLQNNLLTAYNRSGQVDRALGQYKEAVEQNPENTTYRYNYGSMLLQEDKFDEAIEVLTELVSMDASNPDAFYNLGAAYVNKAIAVNEEAVAIEDRLRDEAASLTDEEIAEGRSTVDRLSEERRSLFVQAIVPLENARELAAAAEADESMMGICAALYQAYVQTNQVEMAEGVEECAGY